jgi:hypothetical protein
MRVRYRWLVGLGVVAILIVVLWRAYIPSGLSGWTYESYLFWSEDRAEFTSPDGEIALVVRVWDGGATDGGNRPTAVIQQRWWGDKVVAKGYLLDLGHDIHLTWIDSRTFTINFVDSKKGRTPAPLTVTLD